MQSTYYSTFLICPVNHVKPLCKKRTYLKFIAVFQIHYIACFEVR